MTADAQVTVPGALTRYAGNPTGAGAGFIVVNGQAAGGQTYDYVKAGPRAVLKMGLTDYRMWYEGVSDTPSRVQVCYATSPDGSTWTKYGGNPVLVPSPTGTAPTWEHNELSVGTVLWDADASLFNLWGHGGNNSGPRQVYYATSPDGFAWTRYVGNPVITVGAAGAWDESVVADISVIKVGPGDYRSWWRGQNASNVIQYGYATSPDGITWTKSASNPVFSPSGGGWESVLSSPAVVLINGVFHMWYAGAGGGPPAGGLGYASSVDGITWVRGASNPVLSPSGSPDLDSVGLGDTVWAYLDGTTVRVLYGADNIAGTPTRGTMEATITGPAADARLYTATGIRHWPNGTVGLSALASLAANGRAGSGQILSDRWHGHAATIALTLKTGGSAPADSPYWEVWLEGSTDGGATFGTDQGVYLGALPAPTTINTTAKAEFDTAGKLAVLPDAWRVVVVNRTGQAMNASGHLCSVLMRRA